MKDSVLFRNLHGIAAFGLGTIVIADVNVITDNNGYGLQSNVGGIVFSRQNNTSFGNSLGDMAPTPLGAI